jgi:hypothetical protein
VSKAFSIKDHGPDLAKQMAVAERERQLEQKMMYMRNAGNALTIAYRETARPHGAAGAEARPAQ